MNTPARPWQDRVQLPQQPKRLLIVEDQPAQLLIFTKAAQARGWQVVGVLMDDGMNPEPTPDELAACTHICITEAQLGSLLNNAIRGRSVDAVLTDYLLGVTSGDDVVRMTKALACEHDYSLPVIGHSADLNCGVDGAYVGIGADTVAKAFKDAGADATLAKFRYLDKKCTLREDNANERHKTLDALFRRTQAQSRSGIG